VYGSIVSHDKICRWLADGSGAAVASVDYRLAPEHKFPTPLDEAVAVLDWVIANAGELGVDSGRIGMGGDSAGASITLGTALTLKATGRSDVLKFLLLFYGNYGLGYDSLSSRRYNDDIFGLPEARRRFYRSCYVAGEADHDDPRLKPLSADLSGLPPAFIGAAEMDPLCDNSPALSEALRAAGVATELRVYPGVLHGFLHMTRMVTLAREALDDAADALRRGLA
jgi:acetyl esterase